MQVIESAPLRGTPGALRVSNVQNTFTPDRTELQEHRQTPFQILLDMILEARRLRIPEASRGAFPRGLPLLARLRRDGEQRWASPSGTPPCQYQITVDLVGFVCPKSSLAGE